MASIQKRDDKWRAFVLIDGVRRSKTFKLKKEAVAWANEQELEGVLENHTFKEICAKYKAILEGRSNSSSYLSKLRKIEETASFADLPLEYITKKMIADYRDRRSSEVAPSTVTKDLKIIYAMFKLAINDLGWLRTNPCVGVVFPEEPPSRRRGIAQHEIDAIVQQLDASPAQRIIAQMFLLSIETGMRQGEMLDLRWPEVREKSLTLLKTKNGDKREIPLSLKAREIIATRKGVDPDRVFPVDAQYVKSMFCRARNKTPYKDVRFHDARSEAVTRLSRKLDVLQLAKVIGHRDPRSLMFYYAESADDMADRL